MLKTAPPSAKVRVREMRSERGPANIEEIDAVMRMDETMRPCSVGEMGSNFALNCGMTVTGPMDPAYGIRIRFGEAEGAYLYQIRMQIRRETQKNCTKYIHAYMAPSTAERVAPTRDEQERQTASSGRCALGLQRLRDGSGLGKHTTGRPGNGLLPGCATVWIDTGRHGVREPKKRHKWRLTAELEPSACIRGLSSIMVLSLRKRALWL